MTIVFACLLLIAFVTWGMAFYNGLRSILPFVRWRRLLADKGVAPFGLLAVLLPTRFVPEFRLAIRLLGSAREDDPAAEWARAEARARLIRSFRWSIAFLVLLGVAALVSLL